MFHRLVADAVQDITSRIDFSKIAWGITCQQPLFGIGLGNFVLAAPSYDVRGLVFAYPTEVIVHNLPLLLASEVGIVGFLFALLFSVVLVVRLTRCIFSNNPILAGFRVALLGSLAAMFVSGLFDSVMRNEIVVLHIGVVAGLGMAIVRSEAEKVLFTLPNKYPTSKTV
jgi:O-antigen ligase